MSDPLKPPEPETEIRWGDKAIRNLPKPLLYGIVIVGIMFAGVYGAIKVGVVHTGDKVVISRSAKEQLDQLAKHDGETPTKEVALRDDSGGRDTGADDDDIGPSIATIDWPSLTVTIRRTDTGEKAGPVALAGGERVALMTWGPQGHRLLDPADAEPVPADDEQPAPPPLVGGGQGRKPRGGCSLAILLSAGALAALAAWAVG